MKQLFAALLLAGVLTACDKDKFETTPTVRILSFGPDEVSKGDIFQFRAEITDNEGDIADTVLLVQKRFNGSTLLTTDTLSPVSLTKLGVPDKRRAELQLNFAYGEQVENTITYPRQERIDIGLVLGIIVRDRAKNRSTYVESRRILLKKV